jgi:hypothetical protein
MTIQGTRTTCSFRLSCVLAGLVLCCCSGTESRNDSSASTRDTVTLDLAPIDSALPDRSVKVDASKDPCSSVGTPDIVYSANMVVCAEAGVARTQCQAEELCNTAGGWHLCTATEYLARGGKLGKSLKKVGWIASCIRSDGVPNAPTDKVCACKPGTSRAQVKVAWHCLDDRMAGFGSDELFLGVSSSTACTRIGVKTAATAGFWMFGKAIGTTDRALCCR